MTITPTQPAIRATGLRKSFGGQLVGAHLGPGAGDDHLERLGRVLGQLVRPEPLHQPGRAGAGRRSPASRPGGPAAAGR